MANVKCIDVSEWQGSIDWKKVKSSGIDFAILRAGFGREASQMDKRFELNYKNAKAAGLKLGAYWYSYAASVADAKREAMACLEVIKGKKFELPVFYDMEEGFQTSFGKETLTDMAMNFMWILHKAGFKVGIYANLNWFNNYLDYNSLRGTYYTWLAQYHTEAQLKCDMWQYSSSGIVNGISGGVDMNIIYSEELIKLTNKGGTSTMGDMNKTENFETAGLQALLRQAYAQGIVKTFVKPIDNKKGKLTNAAIIEAKEYLGLKNPDTTISLSFISDLEHAVNVKRIAKEDALKAKANGDINGDGKVNIKDATALQKKIAGVE